LGTVETELDRSPGRDAFRPKPAAAGQARLTYRAILHRTSATKKRNPVSGLVLVHKS
jgi:hypothetical protein